MSRERRFVPPELRPAWEIIEKEELAEQIGDEMARQLKSILFPALTSQPTTPITVATTPVTPLLQSQFPSTALRFLNPHQYLIVPANSQKRVYYYKLPPDHMGVIQRIGNTYYPDTKARWLVDGNEVYGKPIEREIASINSLLELRPPIPVMQRVEWYITNSSGEYDRECHVVIEGISCHRSEFALLLSWLKVQ